MGRRGVERTAHPGVEQRSGINVELTQYDREELDGVLDDIALAGFYWLRQRFPWEAVEPAPGVFAWERWDLLIQAVREHDLGMIAVLDGAPAWALRTEPLPLPCEPPYDRMAYAGFVSALARRYAASIDYYQVWDEPNLSRSWGGGHVHACGYAALLKVAYPALHEADPVAFVLGGALAPTQAPGPDNLNDLIYLRDLYAMGGGAHMDILAVKAYGFWSGPEDRRVEPDVLDFSRVVGLRERMRAAGEGSKPVWAVEWGWNVWSEGSGTPPPWGGDALDVQRARILDAVSRVRSEWRWMGVMCWAAYQPAAAATSPPWGFALRGIDEAPTGLWKTLRAANRLAPAERHRVPGRFPLGRAGLALVISLLGLAMGIGLGAWGGCRSALNTAWARWYRLSPGFHLAALFILGVLFAITPYVEWLLVEFALAVVVLIKHPRWPLLGAVLGMPFFYFAKLIDTWPVTVSEVCLWLALVVRLVRWVAVSGRVWAGDELPVARVLREHVSLLDVAWLAWVVAGWCAARIAPDLLLGVREWRWCLLEPALLYLVVRHEGGGPSWGSAVRGEVGGRSWGSAVPGEAGATGRACQLAGAWLLSGVIVALVGIGQWIVGAWVAAGSVGRVTGVYYSPNHLALYLERLWPVALSLCVALGRRCRLAMCVGAAILGVGLYLTFSRGAWLLAVPVALVTLGIAYRRTIRWPVLTAAVPVVLAAALTVVVGRSTPGSVFHEEVRIPVWQSSLAMIADHPLLGVGLDGFRFVYPRYMAIEAWTEPLLYHPHNAWLDAGVRMGLVGLAIYGVLVAGTLVAGVRALKRLHAAGGKGQMARSILVGCLAGVLGGLAHGLVDSGYFLVDLAWGFALVCGLIGQLDPLRCPDEIVSVARC